MKLKLTVAGLMIYFAVNGFASSNNETMMNHSQHNMGTPSTTILSEAGNDAFGTIQEVILKLNSNPDTDWSKVNLEKLRRHLIDMNNITLNVKVISQTKIKNGLLAIVKPTTLGAKASLQRIFQAHPMQLKAETGWNMSVKSDNGQYILKITTKNKKDIDKIRGLGYIGLMAYGTHHQEHHWAMATGKNPHKIEPLKFER